MSGYKGIIMNSGLPIVFEALIITINLLIGRHTHDALRASMGRPQEAASIAVVGGRATDLPVGPLKVSDAKVNKGLG